ncbi:[citrate (pro-3S)-lyase] ligase [Moellerella wisconsensis]|uniref:[citrate (pro-3S)-lyase] ligase n=1 Tax=Moellerella wisconsensis TaxID=158849 RepID=UPI001F4E4EA1|nr:[citrate (pro-3S)-lyase] ligase [Moellerella wisconsensis]UNH43622.1 [citrate (pro-3S)-lyase] ligase [Moellerella wisconsensis]
MFEQIAFHQVKRHENRKIIEISKFLQENNLDIDSSVDVFITVTKNDKLIACGGLAKNIIKCVAISDDVRGEGLALKLATELINLAYENNITHLFIYTKTENEILFKQCGFHTLTIVPGIMVLMENSCCYIKRYIKSLSAQRKPGTKIGSIVMNANPFTLGHRYLIQQAAKQCDWLHLFVVKEDTSRFPYADRLNLIEASTQDIPNLIIHKGSEYIISRATFPCYFIKEQAVIDHCYTEIDIKIFRQYIAPALGITHRFVGTEPFCAVTHQYNEDMRYWLETKEMPFPAIELVELQRMVYNGTAISASQVRRLLAKKDLAAIKPIVPEATYQYLQKLVASRPVSAPSCSENSTLVTGEL